MQISRSMVRQALYDVGVDPKDRFLEQYHPKTLPGYTTVFAFEGNVSTLAQFILRVAADSETTADWLARHVGCEPYLHHQIFFFINVSWM